MVVVSTGLELEGEVVSPPLAPVEPVIDRDHLYRMTLGEPALEQEVLELFDRQAAMLLARMQAAKPAVVAAAAHTLKGSALGLGAFKVARAAEAVELASKREAAALPDQVRQLALCVDEAHTAIAELLRTH